jgi:phosphatidylglycerol:prolipoprotein diacylglycerol transferase
LTLFERRAIMSPISMPSFPVYFRVGGALVHPHWVLEALGYALGFATFRRLRARYGDVVSSLDRWWVIAAAAAGGAIGSKILFWVEDMALTLRHWNDPIYLMGGKSIVGGLLGGLIAVEWAKAQAGVTTSTGDLLAVPLSVGIAVGRVGCFLTGLSDRTFGSPTSLPWGVDFGDGIARHPTQLYEIAFLIPLGLLLLRQMRLPHRRGDIFKAFMACYLAFRFAIEWIKPEPRPILFSSIQWACVFGLVYYAADIRRWLRRDLEEAPTTA